MINRTHTATDLINAIDVAEKRMFDAIDGTCTIGEIAEVSPHRPQDASRLDIAPNLFQRLWWYDQVVFDTSRQRHEG